MPSRAEPSGQDHFVDALAVRADLPTIAEELGLRVSARGTPTPKALCPFHEDKTPSLVFYPGSASSRGHYHCFACGAHGDVFGLVMRLRDCNFRSALEWLAQRYQLPLPTARQTTSRTVRSSGLELALKVYQRQTQSEAKMLQAFAKERGFKPETLTAADVFVAEAHKLSKNSSCRAREAAESLREVGLMRSGELPAGNEGVPLPLNLPWRDFFARKRVLFALRDDRGRLVGFAGRALEPEDEPKYLYTPGFPRAETLYRFDRARATLFSRLNVPSQVADLYVVEGLLDALRFEELGLASVAILGSQISDSQVRLLTRLADDLDREDRALNIHFFLDADAPGRAGLRRSLRRLLVTIADEKLPRFAVDVIAPQLMDEKGDPDSLLLRCGREEVRPLLAAWNFGALEWLLADALGISPERLKEELPSVPSNQQQRAYRSLERLLPPGEWLGVLSRFSLFDPTLAELEPSEVPARSEWRSGLESFLLSRAGMAAPPTVSLRHSVDRSDYNKLQNALRVAQASSQRRELPVDEGSWHRLEAAIDLTIPALCEQLRRGELPSEPYVATCVPRSDGDFRPKALPSPETLTAQQYVLNELLREFIDASPFAQAIPAVRSVAGHEGVWTTGLGAGPETVSFGYQIDMDIVEARRVPQREGMFRPYSACWRDFISEIDNRVNQCRSPMLHVARVDIRRFYDTLPRSAVIAALLEPVRSALHVIAALNDGSAVKCAPLFRPAITEPELRAQCIVDWLCDQSFEVAFEDRKTGATEIQLLGIPQGPDLSAYLANVALFPLDKALQKLTAELGSRAVSDHPQGIRGGVYARYVDDMVLVATTPHDLARMRDLVEQELTRLSLTSSPKTEPLPAMKLTELREWLTEKRGLALGASSPFSEPPLVEPLSALEPLADAGEIDRSDSLELLHTARYVDPDTSPEEVEDAVRIARRGSDLRHGEKAKAAQLLWSIVVRMGSANHVGGAEQFAKLWQETAPEQPDGNSDSPSAHLGPNLAELLAWLDGLERVLCSRPNRNPSFAASQQEALHGFRRTLAGWVCAGLCNELEKRCDPTQRESYTHMLRLRCMAILRAALVLAPTKGVPNWFKKQSQEKEDFTPAECRLLFSIGQAAEDADFLTRAKLQPAVSSPWLLLHEAIARLQIEEARNAPVSTGEGMQASEPRDPLEALQQRVRDAPKTSFLMSALAFLIPDLTFTSPGENQAAQAAARMLSTLVPSMLAALFSRRLPLSEAVLGQGKAWEGDAIASPPGLQVPGLIGIDRVEGSNAARVVRVDFTANDDSISLSPSLTWKSGEPMGNQVLHPHEADLGSRRCIKPRAQGDSFTARELPRLARAFRALAKPSSAGVVYVCPVTPVNVLGPDFADSAGDEASAIWEPLGYRINIANLQGHAFVRRSSGLAIEWVPQRHDTLWRVGAALADMVGRWETSRSLEGQRFSESANRLESTGDWTVEAMLRYSLVRLRGTAFPSNAPVPVGQDFPASIERVLGRMETFPDSLSNGVNREFACLAHLFATLAEGRALYALSECDFDWTLPGGAVALLTHLAAGVFRVDEELAQHLPANADAWPTSLPKRRQSLAWLGVALRVGRLAAADPRHHSDRTLSMVATGARLLAFQAEVRAQALEHWARLDAVARDRIRRQPPVLGSAWPLDDTALLHRRQAAATEVVRTEGTEANVQFLFDTLSDATAKVPMNCFALLEGITPLGWLVVLATLAATFQERGSTGPGVKHTGMLPDLHRRLANVATLISVSGDSEGEQPWGIFSLLEDRFSPEQVNNAFAVLEEFDAAMGVEVRLRESSFFSLKPQRRRGVVRYASETGSFELPSWQIGYSEVPGGRGHMIEYRKAEEAMIFRYVETLLDGRLLGVSVVQEYLAALGDLKSGPDSLSSVTRRSESNLPLMGTPPPPVEEPAAEAAPPLESPASRPPAPILKSTPPAPEVVSAEPTSSAAEEKSLPSASKPSPTGRPATPSTSPTDNALVALARLQEQTWASLPDKPFRHARVAFFQWDVDDSYRHPLFDACRIRPAEAPDAVHPHNWKRHKQVPSCAEHRRRELLKEVLRVCSHFRVDILVLPEYSMRPDTVEWLRNELPIRR